MKYFGTDGIRRKAEDFTSEFLTSIVAGLVEYAGDNIKVFLAGDTRESTEWILQDLASSCESFGLEYGMAGVLPTPAINYCFYEMGFDFAIDVTASHNSAVDNGIKIFERGEISGQKLSEQAARVIERVIDEEKKYVLTAVTDREDLHGEALELYIEHLKEYLGEEMSLSGKLIGLDCANGATSVVGESVFVDYGAEVQIIHNDDEYNTDINRGCGSTHMDSLQRLVVDNQLDFGVAFDGDGDRCLLVDEKGEIVDGDQIIVILAQYLGLEKIAVTVMTNQGLLNWAKENQVEVEETAVGDSNVAAAMREKGIQIGGEQSGHIILPGESTGDGMLTALMVAKVVSETGRSLSDLAGMMKKSPQVMVNMEVAPEQKEGLKTSEKARELLLDYNKRLEECHGRLLVRPSGTENLIRVTMWGDDMYVIDELAHELANKLGEVL